MGANILTALSLLSAGAVYGYVRYQIGRLKTVVAPHEVRTPPAPKGGDGLAVMNILLIGNNTRTGLNPAEAAQFGSASDVTGARSDVTMILHLDPVTDTASLLSIPRDLFVSLPAHSLAGGYGKIDAGLNGFTGNPKSGPDDLIQTIEDDLGIPINHYISLNFDGFQETINAIGGVKMNFPVPLRDFDSALSVQAGCQRLNGQQALAVVRARHLQYYQNGYWHNDPESDLSRIVRDHIFLKVFANTARSKLTSIFDVNGLVNGLLDQTTVDSGMNVSTLLKLFRHYRHINVNTVAETTLPITVVGNYHYAYGSYGDVDMPVEPLDHQVINAWEGGPLPATAPSGLSVQVVNTSGTYEKAAQVATGLSALGYRVAGTSTGTVPASVSETVLKYHPGSVADALGVLHNLNGAVMMQADATVAAGSVRVDVGSVVTVASPPAATPAATTTVAPGTPATTQAAPTTSTTLPTAGDQTPSSSADQVPTWDPGPC